MVSIVYSLADEVSIVAGKKLVEISAAKEIGALGGLRHFEIRGVDILELKGHHLQGEGLDKMLHTDCILIVSRHSSKAGVPAFAVHPEGNWSNEAKVGGTPKQLSVAQPIWMLKVLQSMQKNRPDGVEVTYEATHHGPLLKTPSLYAEMGGDENAWHNAALAERLGKMVLDSIDTEPHFDKIAFGIGGMHYPQKFTKLALEGKYAFGHMMPKHHAKEVDMIGQAVERCSPAPEIAVIEWKSLKADERERIIAALNAVGMDHVRA